MLLGGRIVFLWLTNSNNFHYWKLMDVFKQLLQIRATHAMLLNGYPSACLCSISQFLTGMNFEQASVWPTTASPLMCVRLRHKDTAPHNRNQCSFIRDRPLGTIASKRRGQDFPGKRGRGSRENPSAAVWVRVRARSHGIKEAWGCYCEIRLDTHSPQPLFSNAGKNISEKIG